MEIVGLILCSFVLSLNGGTLVGAACVINLGPARKVMIVKISVYPAIAVLSALNVQEVVL